MPAHPVLFVALTHRPQEDFQRSANRGLRTTAPGQLVLAHSAEPRHGSTKPPVLIPAHVPPKDMITGTGARSTVPHRIHNDKGMAGHQPSNRGFPVVSASLQGRAALLHAPAHDPAGSHP
ncbi:hypothetical protein TPA0905_30190 [Streptomyces olivaceus]|nr:hypothetical protein TPA0905_30190 [Streptomyces olivaceus]